MSNENILLDEAEKMLRDGKIEEARQHVEPIYTHYMKGQLQLTLRLQRFMGVYVALLNGVADALKLLDVALPE